jgi:hypothetical protein
VPEPTHNDDYVWHFRLSGPATTEQGCDALTEMVRDQVEALLRCLTFTEDGRDVRVTGFRLLNSPAEVQLRCLLRTGLPDDFADSAKAREGSGNVGEDQETPGDP